MSTKTWLVIALACLLSVSALSATAEPGVNRPAFDVVAKIATVTERDGSGRAQRFKDSANREFAVKYDARQRVQSVEATRGAHISDIVSVGYASDGKLIGVMFRSGYTLFYDHRADGTQVIRDSHGSVMRRDQGATSLRPVDGIPPSDKLAGAAAGFESLMKTLER